MIRRLLLPGFGLVALATCASAPNVAFYTRDLCVAPGVLSPDGQCDARYRQQWSVGGTAWKTVDTQVQVSCKVVNNFNQGAAPSAYSEQAEHGVALRWLSDDQLEVGIPAGMGRQRPPEMSWFSDGHIELAGRMPNGSLPTADPAAIVVRKVNITYRDLTPKDRAWKHGCYRQRPKAKAS